MDKFLHKYSMQMKEFMEVHIHDTTYPPPPPPWRKINELIPISVEKMYASFFVFLLFLYLFYSLDHALALIAYS